MLSRPANFRNIFLCLQKCLKISMKIYLPVYIFKYKIMPFQNMPFPNITVNLGCICGMAWSDRNGMWWCVSWKGRGSAVAIDPHWEDPSNLSQFSPPCENVHTLKPAPGYWVFQEAASLLFILALLFPCLKQTNIVWSGNQKQVSSLSCEYPNCRAVKSFSFLFCTYRCLIIYAKWHKINMRD